MTEAPKKIWAADQEFAEGIEGPWHVDKSVYGGELYHHDAEVQRLVAEARAEAFEEAAKLCNERGAREEVDYGLNRGTQNYYRARDAIRALSDTPPRQVTPQEAAKVLLGTIPNPAFDTLKPILMGEHSVNLPDFDEDGQEYVRKVNVPWDVQKRIIADAIRALANGGDD